MRISSAIGLLLFIVPVISLQAQKNEKKDVAEIQLESNFEVPEKSFDFINHYGIETEEFNIYITIEKTALETKPGFYSDNSLPVIPKGTAIRVYKYFPKTSFYAVKYEDSWGFLPSTVLKPDETAGNNSTSTDFDCGPVLLSKLKIEYPKHAFKRRLEGKVIIRLTISKTGAVKEMMILQSVPGLDSAAIEQVRKLRFKPAMKNKQPVESNIILPFEYKLPEQKG